MPNSALMVYEPIDKFGRMSEYWSKYISFYEKYWGGPTSPYGVWFGDDYRDFQYNLSKYLEVDKIQDCLFMKGSDGKYLISPLRSFKNKYMLHSDNHIPLQWFILFEDNERKFFYTHMGFGRIHYGTDLKQSLSRIDKADRIIENSITTHKEATEQSAFLMKLKKIQSDLFELRAWLSEFDTFSYLVLDYGELCSFISPYTLNMDHSSKEVWDMMNNLDNGNIVESKRVLNSLLQKWETIKQKVSEDILKNDIQ
jgi:hypothetical protein